MIFSLPKIILPFIIFLVQPLRPLLEHPPLERPIGTEEKEEVISSLSFLTSKFRLVKFCKAAPIPRKNGAIASGITLKNKQISYLLQRADGEAWTNVSNILAFVSTKYPEPWVHCSCILKNETPYFIFSSHSTTISKPAAGPPTVESKINLWAIPLSYYLKKGGKCLSHQDALSKAEPSHFLLPPKDANPFSFHIPHGYGRVHAASTRATPQGLEISVDFLSGTDSGSQEKLTKTFLCKDPEKNNGTWSEIPAKPPGGEVKESETPSVKTLPLPAQSPSK